MEFNGTYLIFAHRQRVWRALNDVEVLKAAIPGCDSIAWKTASELDLVIRVNLGIVKPRFSGELIVSDIKEAKSYTLSGRGQGLLLGLARGKATVILSKHALKKADYSGDFLSPELRNVAKTLSPLPKNGTILKFEASGAASKNIMGLGKKLVGKSAQRIIDGFMERFALAMEAPIATHLALPASAQKQPGQQTR